MPAKGRKGLPRRLIPLLTLLALVAGCGSSSGSPGSSGAAPIQDVSLQLDWYPNPDHVGVYTAIDRGFFRRAGLDVTPRQPTDVSDPIKLVAAGRTDLGISYEPELFFAQQQHAPVVAVAAIVPTALNSIITTEPGITTPAGLRGKTIGVDGSASTKAYVDTVLRSSGLGTGDVHTVTVGFNLLPALLAGRVDAIAGGFQNIEGAELAARGLHPVVFPVDRYGVPSYDELVVVANSERLASDDGYRHDVRAFVSALAAGTAYAKAHPATALAVMRANSSRDYRNALATSVPETLRLLDTTSLDPAAWNRFGRWMQAQGLLASPSDGAALVARP
jgi:putative hydroxymethylpyrimidine transport system substrate-binding protein